jgi:hypothetical protein
MRLSPTALLTALAASCLLQTSPAHAGLLGTTVTLNYNYQTPARTTDSLLITAGVEVTCTGGGSGNAAVCEMLTAANQYIDIGDLTIGYSYAGTLPGGFNVEEPNGMTFLNLDPGAPITDVSLVTGIGGLDMSRISFTGSSVSIDMHGLSLGLSNSFALTLTAAPEPGTLAILATGIAAMVSVRRRSAST